MSVLTVSPTTVPRPSFTFHILHIILLGSKKEVSGINTQSNITLMKHLFFSRRTFLIYFPGDSMDVITIQSFSTSVEVAVTVLFYCAGPQPAAICFFDLTFETFKESFHTSIIPHPWYESFKPPILVLRRSLLRCFLLPLVSRQY